MSRKPVEYSSNNFDREYGSVFTSNNRNTNYTSAFGVPGEKGGSTATTTTTVATTNAGNYRHESAKPKIAFKCDGIEFWGSAHSNLDDVSYSNKDLIVNGYGTLFTPRPFIKSAPAWLNMSAINSNSQPNQLLLDWKDFSPPPQSAKLDFWQTIINQAKENGIERIICCCGAGLGRTGTALASFALASGYTNDPEEAINLIRTKYNKRAIETNGQELYLWYLIYEEEPSIGEKFIPEPDDSIPTNDNEYTDTVNSHYRRTAIDTDLEYNDTKSFILGKK